jgi:hypothetical protein
MMVGTTMSKYKITMLLLAFVLMSVGKVGVAMGAVEKADAADLERARNWQDDLRYLAETLPALHTNLYFALPEQEFQSGLATLSQQVGEMTDVELYVALARQIARVGDAHTQVKPNLSLRAVPVQFMKFADGIYPVAWASKYPRMEGARLVAIGDTPINDVYEVLSTLVSHDNQAQLAQAVPGLLSNYDILVATGIVADEATIPYWLETRSGTRELVNMGVEPLLGVDFQQAYDPQGDAVPLYLSKQDWFWQEYLEEERVLYIAYNVCWDRETEKRFDPNSARLAGLPDFATFAESVFAVLEAKPVKAVVIDLRLNGGGNSALGTQFINALARHRKVKGGVQVYGIVGRRTFSSAIINAMDLKKVLRSSLYGEATAGKPNHYGEVRTLELPHSKWLVQYSTKYFRLLAEETDSLYPDVIAEATFADFVAGRDPVLERLLEDIVGK